MSINTKAEKEKLQLIQEKSQQILSELLKDEDNKYCVDCDAKGPRWASWNLGVFLCIRCAGIHRNLGVHISKVKSVNLDSWSAEQVAYMQLMGNSKARAVYEANLPDNFKRPQVDSGLEAFVRAKYEHKKYIAKEWKVPPTPKPAFDIEEERKKEKEKKRNKIVKGQANPAIVEVQTNPVPRPHSSPAGTAINAEKVLTTTTSNNKNGSNGVKLPSTDLLGLTTTSSATSSLSKNNSSDDDQFDAFVSCAPVNKSEELVSIQPLSDKPLSTTATKTNEEEDFFNQINQKAPEEKKLDKESILKLYQSSNLNQTVQNSPLFNLGGISTAPPLQPMNIASNVNVNGFANFNNQANQQQSFLAFNQSTAAAAAAVQPTLINHTLSTNPFLTTSPATNGTPPSTLTSSDLFSSNLNTNLSTNLESQLNGLNLNSQITDSWPQTTNNNKISVGQSLFSANFDSLNEKKLNNGLTNNNIITTNTTTTITPTNNPFLNSSASSLITSTIQPTTNHSNLDILSSFTTTTTTSTTTTNGGLNGLNNDLDGWSAFTSTTNTTNGLTTADIGGWP